MKLRRARRESWGPRGRSRTRESGPRVATGAVEHVAAIVECDDRLGVDQALLGGGGSRRGCLGGAV